MKIVRIAVLSLLVCLPLLAQDPRVAKQIETDIRTLAADSMEGRGLGTKGIELSADYLEKRLRALGLQPAFQDGYRQPFPVKMGVSSGAGNRLDGVASADWTPLGFSSAGRFSAPLVFAGYGIDAPPLGYREFEGIDLKGKVALILRYEPQEKDDGSPFDGRRPSRWSALRYKVLQARERGAVAVIFTTGPLQDEGKDKVPPLANDGPESPAGLPVLQVKTSVAQKWLAAAGIDLAHWQDDVDRDLAPRSRLLPMQVAGMVDVKPAFNTTSNVMGMLPGRGKLASEVVVLGAHYDHLGYGGEGSLRPNVHEIHNGADDNASGTAGVLAAAEILSAELKDVAERRTVIFALFSGEERGLAGSGYFVGHAPMAMEKVVAMVNMDMVGALREDQVTAFGTDSAAEWKALVERAGAGSGLKITASGDGYGPSDQTSFYAVHIPVLHFFTGAHERYHTPDDDADAVNFAGEARVIGVVSKVVSELARGTVTPQYARASAAPAMQGDSRGYGAYLGTVPDYSAMDATTGGVLLSDVRAGGPAERAGIKGGDRILEIGGTRIENLYDMTYALQDHKPFETVDVIVDRKEGRVKLRATLGSRGAMSAPAPTTPSPSASPVPATTPTTAPATAPTAPPANPHATEPPPATVASTFYDGRPGKGFVVGAGKPFGPTFDGEKHLAEIRQLTFGGENAEAYFSPDGKHLIYQSTPPGAQCDQQFILDLASGDSKRVSSGKGRTTCGYFDYPEADRIVYASTEGAGAECPPPPDRSHGYVWAVYPSFDIYEANIDGSNARRLTTTPGYDAEMTWCHRGGKAVFTSMRDGDLDLYEMDEAGNVRRLTNSPGYDGGAFYSADCREIVWRANHPTGAALDEYKALLAKGLVRPTEMEIFVMNADGTNQRQLTNNKAANFCPYFFPDGNRIIYASNVGDPKGREFELWAQDKRGGEAQRITTAPGFDGFPMFSPDGTLLVWASNRADVASHSTNLFIARWVE